MGRRGACQHFAGGCFRKEAAVLQIGEEALIVDVGPPRICPAMPRLQISRRRCVNASDVAVAGYENHDVVGRHAGDSVAASWFHNSACVGVEAEAIVAAGDVQLQPGS